MSNTEQRLSKRLKEFGGTALLCGAVIFGGVVAEVKEAKASAADELYLFGNTDTPQEKAPPTTTDKNKYSDLEKSIKTADGKDVSEMIHQILKYAQKEMNKK